MKRLVLLVAAALVAMLILAPTAFAQGTIMQESTVKVEEPLPSSGGVTPAVLLPAAALLMGSGVLAYAVLRRR
ncbi:MAG: hypothetical protein M3305_17720 [Actinomycetota bacterium]|jgi:hypothetical protein|nr:hypothetical protein [Actinomycetota bacterium]